MTDPSPFALAVSAEWPRVQGAVNAWRGRCINAFARAEVAASEALFHLSQSYDRGSGIKLPHLVGQRFEVLGTALAPEGPFAEEGKEVREALQTFRQHDALRAPLCHGSGKITIDQGGRWTLVLRVTSFRSGKVERRVFVWDESEAEAIAAKLQSDAQRLCSKLDRLTGAAGR